MPIFEVTWNEAVYYKHTVRVLAENGNDAIYNAIEGLSLVEGIETETLDDETSREEVIGIECEECGSYLDDEDSVCEYCAEQERESHQCAECGRVLVNPDDFLCPDCYSKKEIENAEV